MMDLMDSWYLLPFVLIATLLLLYLAVKLVVHSIRRRRRSLSKIYGYNFHTAIRQCRPNVRM